MSLDTLKARIEHMGGDNLGRIKEQKLRSFHAALANDYNSRRIRIEKTDRVLPALINTDNLKADYDKKYLSVDFCADLNPGDTFECVDDGTHWMVYLPSLTEIAYLRTEIIRCRYQLRVNDTDYWIYFQGPTETALRWNLKRDFNWNDLNLSGTIYIENNEETKAYFDRFTKIKLDGHTWQVKVVDSITVPGILELEIQEYFDSPTDGLVEVQKVDGAKITGKSIVRPGEITGYQVDTDHFDSLLSWSVTGNDGVSIERLQADGQACIVKINENAQGYFAVTYGEDAYDVTIDSTVSEIQGKTEVYPYSINTYTIDKTDGQFTINNNSAKIISQENGVCEVEVISGKKGSFTLSYTDNNITHELYVKILSL